MAQLLQAACLVAATVANGLMAGLFAVFAYAVMPGLGRTDDRTFVGAFQSIDRALGCLAWALVEHGRTLPPGGP